MLALLVAVRRRLRWAWALATAQWMAPVVALAALAVVAAGWLRPWAWPEPAALVLAGLALVGVVVGALVVRIPLLLAARAADRGLGTRDAFVASLELADEQGLFPERVRRRAAALASGVRAKDAVPLQRQPRRLLVAAVLTAGAFGLAWLPNPQDTARERRAAEQRVLENEAERLREAAAALGETPTAGKAERAAAEELRELAEKLERAGSLDDGLDEVAKALADLEAAIPADLLATKAAVTGLERSLQSQPLPGTTATSAGEQLRELAAALAELPPEDRAALAERLDQLAATQAVGNPAAATTLGDAAASLRSGDLAGARAALGEAAGAQSAGADRVAAGEADSRAADAVAETADRLADRAGSGSRGRGPGEGNGEGSGGRGAGGSGEGAGQGSGEGGGQGQGQGGGSPSGNVAGSTGGTGSGQGGPGRPGSNPDGTGRARGSGEETGREALVYVPGYTEGEQLRSGGSGSGDPGETVGRGNNATARGGSWVPASEVPQAYREAFAEALDRPTLPPTLRDVIRAYLESTAGL